MNVVVARKNFGLSTSITLYGRCIVQNTLIFVLGLVVKIVCFANAVRVVLPRIWLPSGAKKSTETGVQIFSRMKCVELRPLEMFHQQTCRKGFCLICIEALCVLLGPVHLRPWNLNHLISSPSKNAFHPFGFSVCHSYPFGTKRRCWRWRLQRLRTLGVCRDPNRKKVNSLEHVLKCFDPLKGKT